MKLFLNVALLLQAKVLKLESVESGCNASVLTFDELI